VAGFAIRKRSTPESTQANASARCSPAKFAAYQFSHVGRSRLANDSGFSSEGPTPALQCAETADPQLPYSLS
jgi:hypothetical protein